MNDVLLAFGNSAAIGTVMPLLIAFVVRAHWPAWTKAAVAVTASLVAGTLGAWAAGELTGLPWAGSVVAALISSQQAYARWWRPTGIAPWVEQVTTPTADPVGPES